MGKEYIKKLAVFSMIATSVLALNLNRANAEWKYDVDTGWHYEKEDSYTTEVEKTKFSKLIKNSIGQEILKNISVQNSSFNIYNLSSDLDISSLNYVIQDEIDKLKITNPYEMLNLEDYNVSISGDSSGKIDIGIYCTYRMTRAMANELDARVRSIVANIAPDNMSQAEKERAIHDWIINNTRYDQSHTIYDPYNTLIKHVGVCEGYSLLAQKMFTVAGIKSMIIEGVAGGESHSWNMVYIDNKWHHVDCTWDDPISSNDILQYNYYNLTDSKIALDHSWNVNNYPRAN